MSAAFGAGGGSFGDIFGDVAAPAMDTASKYAAAAEDLEADRMMKTLSALEQQVRTLSVDPSTPHSTSVHP